MTISDAQALVRAFQENFFGPQPSTPLTEDQVDWDEHTLRLEWMDSEHSEIETAIRRRNIADLADGYLDDLFYALGGLVRLGIDAAPLFQAITDANMAKVRIPGLAKIAKPEGWTPPDIAGLIEKQRTGK
jgi:predicted HAD superfamily Cof-like phosphohydrolase